MDTFWSDFGEVVEDSEREASESAALSGGREDDEEREASEPAALSGGREDDEEREASESAALSGGRRYDEEGEASESATLNEGRETRLDFLEVVEEDCVDFPAAESLLDLWIVMRNREIGMGLNLWRQNVSTYMTQHGHILFADTPWFSDADVTYVVWWFGKPWTRSTEQMVVKREDQEREIRLSSERIMDKLDCLDSTFSTGDGGSGEMVVEGPEGNDQECGRLEDGIMAGRNWMTARSALEKWQPKGKIKKAERKSWTHLERRAETD
jgi:hypothetical protein